MPVDAFLESLSLTDDVTATVESVFVNGGWDDAEDLPNIDDSDMIMIETDLLAAQVKKGHVSKVCSFILVIGRNRWRR
jgi:hypothetical protein